MIRVIPVSSLEPSSLAEEPRTKAYGLHPEHHWCFEGGGWGKQGVVNFRPLGAGRGWVSTGVFPSPFTPTNSTSVVSSTLG